MANQVVLFEDHDHEGSHRMVQLTGTSGHMVNDVRAKMYRSVVTVVRTHETESPQQFSLTADEMDLLSEQWLEFKAARAEWLAKEQQQVHDAVAEAYRLAEVHGFNIHEAGDTYQPCWKGGSPYTRGYVYGLQLLACIQEMVTMSEEANA